MSFIANNKVTSKSRIEAGTGHRVINNNLVREILPLFNQGRNRDTDIMQPLRGGLRGAKISDTVKFRTRDPDFKFLLKHAKPFAFLMEKIALSINSNTPLERDSHGDLVPFRIEISRGEWDIRTGDKNKRRAFLELYKSLQSFRSLEISYEVKRNNTLLYRTDFNLVYKAEIEPFKKKIVLKLDGEAVKAYKSESTFRATLPAGAYLIPDKDPYQFVVLSRLIMDYYRYKGPYTTPLKRLISALNLDLNTKYKSREIIDPIKRALKGCEKFGLKIDYVTPQGTRPKKDDFTTFRRFYEMSIKVDYRAPSQIASNNGA